MSIDRRGQGIPTPAPERVLKPGNIDRAQEAGLKSTAVLAENLENFKTKIQKDLEKITGDKRLELEGEIRKLTKRIAEVAKEASEFEGEDEKLEAVKEKIENLEIEISNALATLEAEIYSFSTNKESLATNAKENYQKSLDGFDEVENILNNKLGQPQATPDIKDKIIELKTKLGEFVDANKKSLAGFDGKQAISEIKDRAKEIDQLIKAVNDKKLKPDIFAIVQEKLKAFIESEKQFSSLDSLDAQGAVKDLLKRTQDFRNKVKKIPYFREKIEKLINEIPVIISKQKDEQLDAILEAEQKFVNLEIEWEGKNINEAGLEKKSNAKANVADRIKIKQANKAEAARLAIEEQQRLKAEQAEAERVATEEAIKDLHKARLQRESQEQQEEQEAYETTKNRSKEIPVSLIIELVEAVKDRSASAVSETVNFILSKELSSVVEADIDEDAHIKAIENMFDDIQANFYLSEELEKYGIKDWETFVKVWKNELARNKVAPAMEAWLKGEIMRRAITTTESGSGWDRFNAALHDFNISPVGKKIIFSAVVVGGGALAGGALLSGVGVAAAAGAAIGGSTTAIIRTWLNRNCKWIKNWDKQAQEGFMDYSNKKDLRLINNFLESSAQSFTAEYFGIEAATTNQGQGSGGKQKKTGFFGGVVSAINRFRGKPQKHELQTVNTASEISREGAFTLGAIISESLKKVEEEKQTGHYQLEGMAKEVVLTGQSLAVFESAKAKYDVAEQESALRETKLVEEENKESEQMKKEKRTKRNIKEAADKARRDEDRENISKEHQDRLEKLKAFLLELEKSQTNKHEVDGRLVVLNDNSNEIYVKAIGDLANLNLEAEQEIAIKNKLLLKLQELQTADSVALSKIGLTNKAAGLVDGLFKTMSGRGSDNSAKAYLGASVMGGGIAYAVAESSDTWRAVMGGLGGASIGSKLAESGINREKENESRSKLLSNLDQLRLRVSTYENIFDDEDKKETQKMLRDLKNLKDGTAGDLGDILALQNNPVLRTMAESLLNEAESKGIIRSKPEQELSLDFSDLDKVKESIKTIEGETDRRAKQVDDGVKRNLSGGSKFKKAAYVTLGAAVGVGAALLVGVGVRHVKHEYGVHTADNKLDELLAGKSPNERVRILEHFSSDKNIKTVQDLSPEQLSKLNAQLSSPEPAKWIHNQEVEIKKEDMAEVEDILKSNFHNPNAHKALLFHFSNGKSVDVAGLSNDQLKNILDHKNDEKWWDEQSQIAYDKIKALPNTEGATGNNIDTTKINIVLDKEYSPLLGSYKSGDILNSIYSQNPKMSPEELVGQFDTKMKDLYSTAQDVAGGSRADMTEVGKIVQADLIKHNGDIDAVLRDLRATVGKNEGISHALARQFKAELVNAQASGGNEALKKLGFTGDIDNPREVNAWANSQAGTVAKQAGFFGKDFDIRVRNANHTQVFLERTASGGVGVKLNTLDDLYKIPRETTPAPVAPEKSLPALEKSSEVLHRDAISYLEDQKMSPYNRAGGQQDYFTDLEGKHWVPQGYVKDKNGDLITVLQSGVDVLFYKNGGEIGGLNKVEGFITKPNTLYNIKGEEMGVINKNADDHEVSLNNQKAAKSIPLPVKQAGASGGSERAGNGLPQGISADAKGGYLLETGGNKIKVGAGVPEKDLIYLKDNLSRLSNEARVGGSKGIAGGINNLKLGMAQKIIEAGGPNTAQKLASLINGDHVEIPGGGKALSAKLDIHGHKIEIPSKFGTEGLGLLEKNLKIFDARFEELEALKTTNPNLYEKINPLLSSHFEVLRAATGKGSVSLANNFDSGTKALKSQELMTIHLDTLKDLKPNSNGVFEIPFGERKIVL